MNRIFLAGTALLVWATFTFSARADDYPDQGAAYAACMEAVQRFVSSDPGSRRNPVCEQKDVFGNVKTNMYVGWGQYTPNGEVWQRSDVGVFGYPEGAQCASRPEQTGWAGTSQYVCHNGCAYTRYADPAIGTYYSTFDDVSNKVLGVCTATSTTPAPTPGGDDGGGTGGETGGGDGDGGTNPDPGGGDSGGGDGGSGGDGGDGGGGDDGGDDGGDGGTDPGGGPGTGGGDGEGGGSASGGEGCDAPPACSGDPIACSTNWQIWRMRCNGTAAGKVEGDIVDCKKAFSVTSPDPLANAQLALQRKIACKDADQPEWTKVTGDGNDAGTDPKPGDFVKTLSFDPDRYLDEAGFLGGGSCPYIPSISVPVLNYTFDSSSFTYYCDLMKFVRGLIILLFGALPACLILLSRNM